MADQLDKNKYMNDDFPFHIMRTYHDPDNKPEVHGHDFIELVYIVQGHAEHVIDNRSYQVQAGDVFIVNPGEFHNFLIKPGEYVEIINCLFMPGLISHSLLRELQISNSMDFFYVHPFLDNNERFHHLLNFHGSGTMEVLPLLEAMIEELARRHTGYATLIRLRMIELLVMLSRYYTKARADYQSARHTENELTVKRICGYLERHCHEKITLGSLSRLFNLSDRQLNRMFNQQTGMSVFKMLHQIRIKRAKLLLMDDTEKVINVAMSVGYEDPAFFSRLFHRQVGCPPSEYRARVLSGSERNEYFA